MAVRDRRNEHLFDGPREPAFLRPQTKPQIKCHGKVAMSQMEINPADLPVQAQQPTSRLNLLLAQFGFGSKKCHIAGLQGWNSRPFVGCEIEMFQ
jgi:hypothetical protein